MEVFDVFRDLEKRTFENFFYAPSSKGSNLSGGFILTWRLFRGGGGRRKTAPSALIDSSRVDRTETARRGSVNDRTGGGVKLVITMIKFIVQIDSQLFLSL